MAQLPLDTTGTAVFSTFAALIAIRWFRLSQTPRFGGEEDVTAPSGTMTAYSAGKRLVMGFARWHFEWTARHIPGEQIQTWEYRGDKQGDTVFSSEEGAVSAEAFLEQICRDKAAAVDPLPDWVDESLLQHGCDFFVSTWPLVFLAFSWALIGGFGCESAAAVLVESRYWAAKGVHGERDTFQRLQETVAWLFDMCAHGSEGFKPGGAAWHAALHVRWLHGRTRATVAKKDHWEDSKHGVPINQAQLIGTLLGCSVLLLMGMERSIDARFSDRDREGFIHLWRVIGHLFGIEPDLNPNKSYDGAKTAMESVFSFAIPQAPSPENAGLLTSHICASIARGFREQYGVPMKPEHLAARARIFMGNSYGAALGLPAVRFRDKMAAWASIWFQKAMFLPYVWLNFKPIRNLYKKFMLAWFVQAVRICQLQHNKHGKTCRFGQVGDVSMCPAFKKSAKVVKNLF